ncbi:vanadium-dependent haloperoxidase [Winogradskyella maritima]|uniref:Vanadium-dependent haloperoxidase n=1 Tax=Winogradskyella maritima TaxID=1517766 RepID=A0ABV8AHD6_9FLAO|nr:vanadium-dependent haloperoxidase [Winogradskyella maritima]
MTNRRFPHIFLGILLIFLVKSCTKDSEPRIDQAVSSESTRQLIIDWNALWLEVDRYATATRPNATARALAYIHLAGYETAIIDMPGYASNSGRLEDFQINGNPPLETLNRNIALNTCYPKMISHFMQNIPENIKAKIFEVQAENDVALRQGVSDAVYEASTNWGTYIADQVIAYSQTDTEAESQILDPQPFSYEPPVAEGYWTYSADEERAWFPHWKSVRTFVMSPEESSSTAPPMNYDTDISSDYYNAMMEVYESNNDAKENDNEALWIAEFWSDDVENLMMSPPGRQLSIANQVIQQENLEFDTTLALLLKLGFSLNDAAVSAWADKYEYMTMRPSVYIQEHIDTDFQTNLYRFIFWPNPSFPSYPSGHAAFASAAAGVFINELGNDITFTDYSHEGRTEFRGMPRTFSSFSDMAEENAYSRVPLGVHCSMDSTEGLRLGYEISDAVNGLDLSSL